MQTTTQRPWTDLEHDKFLLALERFGSGNSGQEWEYIAQYVQTHDAEDCKAHAHKYLRKLQASGVPVDLDDGSWTREEDKAFEDALATVPEGSPDRWEQIAAVMRHKSPEAIRQRYAVCKHPLGRIGAHSCAKYAGIKSY